MQRVQKRWNRKYFTLKWLNTEQTDQGLKVQYAYKAFLPRSYECRFLEDYTGKVKPFLEKSVKTSIVRLQVVGLDYISEQSIEKINKFK